MVDTHLEERPTSLGGYGSLVPYHGVLSFDPAQGDEGTVVRLDSGGWQSPDEALNLLERASKKIDVGTGRGSLYYSAQNSQFSWYGSGVEQLREDLAAPFELSSSIHSTLENQHGRELDTHRPCFAVIAPARYGFFWMLLRGGKDDSDDREDYDVSFDLRAGVLMEDPILSWPALEELVPSDGPIPLSTTQVESVTASGEDRPLERVVPVDHGNTGDADILAANNMYASAIQGASSDVQNAIEKTKRITYRISGGTIGFEKEREFRTGGMTLLRPSDITLWGHPLVIASPMCNAVSRE